MASSTLVSRLAGLSSKLAVICIIITSCVLSATAADDTTENQVDQPAAAEHYYQPPIASCESDDVTQVLMLAAAFVSGVIVSSLAFMFRPMFLPQFHGPIRWKRVVLATFFLCFLSSIPWEWYRLFKEAMAEKSSHMLQQMPEECNPNRTNFAALRIWMRQSFTFDDDRCAEYHKNIMVDPFWDVTPFQAFSTCAFKFFLEPLTMGGDAMGQAFKGFFKHIPAHLFIPVFLAVFILMLVCIVSMSGFSVSTPLFRIGVRSSTMSLKGSSSFQPTIQASELVDEIKQLRQEVRAITRPASQQAAPAALENYCFD